MADNNGLLPQAGELFQGYVLRRLLLIGEVDSIILLYNNAWRSNQLIREGLSKYFCDLDIKNFIQLYDELSYRANKFNFLKKRYSQFRSFSIFFIR
ncbi:MAG: hypothetical protein H9855_00040 [Candidatus Acinetobacter avistercoris]|nr:hypothetical protein [Candidatus Acinetobacter avistercoris]